MPDSIIDNELLLARDVPNNVFQKDSELNTGYNKESSRWELIIKYNGNLSVISNDFTSANKYIEITTLYGGYAIITINEEDIDYLANYKQIEFIEKPKRLYFSVNNGKTSSCISNLQIQNNNLSLFGEGILVGIIDSGIDYSHPDFRNDDGSTRILEIWDQSIVNGTSPEGYTLGALYTASQINEALRQQAPFDRENIVPTTDSETGHGTHVAGICCGNGRASNGKYAGVAPKSTILVVKLGNSVGESFPRTTRLLEAINYLINRAITLNMPIAINISIGNNYGAHNGRSILENFIDTVSEIWKTSICIGTGNEGSTSKHAGGILTNTRNIELAIGGQEPYVNIQLWKNYADNFNIQIISPSGDSIIINKNVDVTSTYVLGNTSIYVYYGLPTPDNILQEIYIVLYPENSFLQNGIWQINLIPTRILDGRYDIWLSSGNSLTRNTRFLEPDVYTSLTIPSTANNPISVAAYDGLTNSYADFSGRGYTRNNRIKPDIAAPGVNITSASPGGGYSVKSGTSMATPFVTGSAALMMEWGIVKGNDPYMYGEKLKAYLINGAKQLPEYKKYPNQEIGWGVLCLENSIPK